MYNKSIDLIGTICLNEKDGRLTPIRSGYKAHCNIIGESMQDSYVVWLINKDELKPGECSECEFTFLFSDLDDFQKSISEQQILELNEGSRQIGKLIVKTVLNSKLKNHT